MVPRSSSRAVTPERRRGRQRDSGRRRSARFITADLSDLESVRRLAEDAGEIDLLINNAEAFPFAPTPEQALDTFTQLFDTNVQGPFFLTAALAAKMVAKGSGSIVNVTTIAAQRGSHITGITLTVAAAQPHYDPTMGAHVTEFCFR